MMAELKVSSDRGFHVIENCMGSFYLPASIVSPKRVTSQYAVFVSEKTGWLFVFTPCNAITLPPPSPIYRDKVGDWDWLLTA